MTRINVGINPWELPSKLLLAEHREIKRIPNALRKGKACWTDVPPTFRLGKGHVKFFYPRILFLQRRYKRIRKECLRRRFDIWDYSEAFEGLPDRCYSLPYVAKKRDRRIVLDRIESKGFRLNTEKPAGSV